MAALGSQSIASSYEQILQVDRDGGGNGTTHVSVKDGDNGTTFGFTIADDALMMSSTNRLEFGDTGTYIHQSADGVLDLVSDTEIELNATTLDINAAVEVSGDFKLAATQKLYLDGGSNTYIYETSDNVIQFVTNNNTAGPWMSSDGIYIGANNGDNQIRGDSSGGGSATLYIGNQSITTSSDIRIKENIVDTEINALSRLNDLRVVDFNWNDPSDTSFNNKNARGKWTGLIAQEVIEHLPYAVNAVRDEETLDPMPDATNEDGTDRLWKMEYDLIVPVLIKAVQELSTKVEALEG